MKTKKIAIICLILFALIQFIRIDKSKPETKSENDYVTFTNTPQKIADIIKTSCYDCHSNETKYPWYSNIAPISWMLKKHVNEGREHINFSEWEAYSEEMRIAIQEECIYVLEENDMPLKSYTLIHNKAKLSEKQKTDLIEWFDLQVN